VRLLVGHERLEVVDRPVDEDARQVLARDGRHEGVGARREDALVVGDELVAAGHGLFVHVQTGREVAHPNFAVRSLFRGVPLALRRVLVGADEAQVVGVARLKPRC